MCASKQAATWVVMTLWDEWYPFKLSNVSAIHVRYFHKGKTIRSYRLREASEQRSRHRLVKGARWRRRRRQEKYPLWSHLSWESGHNMVQRKEQFDQEMDERQHPKLALKRNKWCLQDNRLAGISARCRRYILWHFVHHMFFIKCQYQVPGIKHSDIEYLQN